MMCDNYVKFKSKSGRHLVFNGEQKKEEQNRNRRNKRHTAFLKNRIIPLTPKENASIISIVKTQSSEEGGKIKRQIAFRDKFKKYLDNKNKKKCSNQPKPFVSAVATGRFIDHANNGKKNDRKAKPLWNQRDLGTIITSTALRPKRSALVAKLYDETISPVEIVSSLPIEQTTPRNGNENTSHYVSPFVTISREVKYSLDCRVEERQKKEAAAYFRLQIERERTRLDSLVSHWQHCADCESPADFRDMINVVIGQTKLLTTSKFKQFDNLIEQCERNECEEIVDLEGFWSLVYLQVENCVQRFEELENLRNNQWKESDLKENAVKKTSKKMKNKSIGVMLKKARKNLLINKMNKGTVGIN